MNSMICCNTRAHHKSSILFIIHRIHSMRLSITIPTLLAIIPSSLSFAPSASSLATNSYLKNPPSLLLVVLASTQESNVNVVEQTFVEKTSLSAPKLSFQPTLPEERGKGGVRASEPISALEVIARIPRSLIIATCDSPTRAMEAAAQMDKDKFTWAADLCATTLCSLFPEDKDDSDLHSDAKVKQEWISGWEAGGWATDSADLGPEDIDWGAKCCTGSLLSTGSDNDKNVYAKFRFPTHPAVFRASIGLAMLTGTQDQEALDALLLRGRVYRSMRDALLPLVEHPSDRKGSLRERKAWDVADMLSRILSRVTTLQLECDEKDDVQLSFAVVPIHERLAHCAEKGENSKLVADVNGDEVLLVATRDIAVDEEITRDYSMAPRLDGDDTEGALRLLLQFGVPPVAARS